MPRIQRLLPTIVFGGLMLAFAVTASAQDWDNAGVVRVSDISPKGLEPIPAGSTAAQSTCPTCQNQGVVNGAPCPNGCQEQCRKDCHCSRCFRQMIDWFNPHGMCTFSPDHGFAPPVKRPIYRSPVVYRKQFPDSWTGNATPGVPGQALPSVYMPTDTTQLGYYYQHVPYWMPKPGAIPPAPRPADWHTPMCQADLPGRHPAGVVFGTAPTVVPAPNLLPTPVAAPVGDVQGIPPAPEPTPYVTPSGLERTSGAPNLLPVR
ncbi:hypothetical protein [Planctomicrobium sp. SH664]|uniref:hypothetical protein n=1 Tax=Planctomicrobium sp. SH664 TaxID=3448125 RepID=UPI003F5B363A